MNEVLSQWFVYGNRAIFSLPFAILKFYSFYIKLGLQKWRFKYNTEKDFYNFTSYFFTQYWSFEQCDCLTMIKAMKPFLWKFLSKDIISYNETILNSNLFIQILLLIWMKTTNFWVNIKMTNLVLKMVWMNSLHLFPYLR